MALLDLPRLLLLPVGEYFLPSSPTDFERPRRTDAIGQDAVEVNRGGGSSLGTLWGLGLSSHVAFLLNTIFLFQWKGFRLWTFHL